MINWIRTTKIIFINVLIITIIFAFVENYCYKIYKERTDLPYLSFFSRYKDNSFQYTERFETKPTEIYKNGSILMMGCSYTYGQWLNENEFVSAKLAKKTGRVVYNTGIIGGGALEQLQFLNEEEVSPKINPLNKPEYIIYTYMFHHIDRWQRWQYYNELRKSGIIPNQHYNILYKLYIYSYFKNIQFDKLIYENEENRIDLFIRIINALKQKSEKMYPNSKFIVLIYSDENYDITEDLIGKNKENQDIVDRLFEIMYSDKFINKLKSTGSIVITTEELIGRRMNKEEDRIPAEIDFFHPHPSSKAWDLILDKLIQKINIEEI